MKTMRAPLALAVLLAACSGGGGGGGGPTAPGGAVLAITVSPSAIALNGVADIGVLAQNANGSAMPGAAVQLVATLGALEASLLTTGADGRATTRLHGDGRTGTSAVRAQIGASGPSAQATLRIGIGAAITMHAEPAVISTTGTTDVYAVVTQLDGTATPSGIDVQMTTTLGRLSNIQPKTDSLGAVHVQLTADGRAGTASLTANTAGAAEPARIDVRIVDAQLALQAVPVAIATDGRATLVATVRNSNGQAAGPGVTVGMSTSLGRLDNSSPVTDSLGQAIATLSGLGIKGQATVRAVAQGSVAELVVPVGQGLSLTLRAAPPTIALLGNSTVTLLPLLPDGRPVAIGTQVLFTTLLGTLDVANGTVAETALATTILRGGGAKGTAAVTAQVVGFAEKATINVPIG